MSDNKRTGDLCNYDTGELIREATFAEIIESRQAATSDGGAGVIKVDGVSCYVEGDADPELEICICSEWVRDWLAAEVDLGDADEAEVDCAADHATTLMGERLTDAGFDVGPARDKRSTLAGWSGCRFFSFRSGPIATFAELADGEKQTIERIIGEAIVDAVTEVISEQQHAVGCSCGAPWCSEYLASLQGGDE
tara:strand:- start:2403 stop:2984 length:582 start_codon:yes stop_codon:yes gene_type:complete